MLFKSKMQWIQSASTPQGGCFIVSLVFLNLAEGYRQRRIFSSNFLPAKMKSWGLGSAATTRPTAHLLSFCHGESPTNVSFCSCSSFCSLHTEPGQ